MPKKLIRFIQTWSPYNSGERAGFPDDVANKLISQGYAAAVVDFEASSGGAVAKSTTATEAAVPTEQLKLSDVEVKPEPKKKKKLGRPRKKKI